MLAWYILIPISLLNFAVGFAVLRRDFRAPMNWAFFGFAAAVGAWVAVDFLLMEAWNEQAAIFFEQLAHLMGVFIAATLWIFTRMFNQRGKLKKLQWQIIQWPTAIMAVATMWPGVLAKGAALHPWGPEVFIYPAYHIAFTTYFSVFFFWGLMALHPRQRFGRTKLACHQARCLWKGIGFAAAGGVLFDIIIVSPLVPSLSRFLLQFQMRPEWIGPIFTILFVIGAYRARRLYFFGIPKAVDVVILEEDWPFSYLKIIRFLKLFFTRRFWVKI